MSYIDHINTKSIVAAPLAAGIMVSSAVSIEATSIKDAYTPRYLALSYGQDCRNLLSELKEIYTECHLNGWDGPHSVGVDAKTLSYTREIIVKLHEAYLPLPEVCAEADGELCLDWIVSQERLFSMSINKEGLLSMLEKDADTRWHGSTLYKGSIPSDVTNILRKLQY